MQSIYLKPTTLFFSTCFNRELETTNLGIIDYSTFFLFSFIAVIITYTCMASKIIRIKRKLLEKEIAEEDFSRVKNMFQKFLIQRFEISKQILIMNSTPTHDPKDIRILTRINEFFYGQPDINFNKIEFYELLNEMYGNFRTQLSKSFPNLNEDEIRICCLLKAGFNTSNICFILRYVPVTIRIKKTKIRKKLGITDGGDIPIFLGDHFEKQKLSEKIDSAPMLNNKSTMLKLG